MHRTIHGSSARCGVAAARCGGADAFCRFRPWHCAAVPNDRIHTVTASAVSKARAMVARISLSNGASYGTDGNCAALVVGAFERAVRIAGWRAECGGDYIVLVLRFRNAGRIRHSGLAAIALCFMILAVASNALPAANGQKSDSLSNILKAEAFSEKRLAALRASGQPVFVYFTADWCVTCKINEAAVLERADTAKLFADKDVKVLRGDFTRTDPAIARFLNQQQAAGVPLYLYYPKRGAGRKLPQLLTTTTLAEAVRVRT